MVPLRNAFSFSSVLLLLILTSAAATASAAPRPVVSGQPAPFEIGPVERTTLFHGDYSIVIGVPRGATKLEIVLETVTPDADVDLVVRHGQDTELTGGRLVADYMTTGETGNETLVITPESTPPLQEGDYYISLALFTFGVKASGFVTATVHAAGWGELSSGVVGTGGGTLSGGGMRLSVPPGAFAEDVSLRLSQQTSEPSAGRVTSFYRLEGLPATVQAPLTLELESAGDLPPGKTLIFMKVEGEEDRGPMVIPAQTVDGRIAATLPAMPAGSQVPPAPTGKSGPRLAVVDPNRFASLFWAMGGVSEERSDGGNFIVHFPTGDIGDYDLALEACRWAEEARTKLQQLGIAVAQRRQPVDIYLYSFSGVHGQVYAADPSTEGQTETELWGKQGIGLSLNLDVVKGAADARIRARTTLIHEMFHVYQSLYDPRAHWRRTFGHSPWLWMMEAASTWSEKLMTADPNYLSTNTQAYTDFLLQRSLEFAPGDAIEVQRHGYGAALFLEFLTMRKGQDVIGSIFRQMSESAGTLFTGHKYTPVQVLQNLDVLLYLNWLTFVEELASAKVHPSVDIQDLLNAPNAKIPSYEFRSDSDSGTTFRWDAPDLSAHLVRIDFQNQNTQWGPGATLRLRLTNPGNHAEAYVFQSVAKGGMVPVAKLQAEWEMRDLVDFAKGRGTLAVIVANGRARSPYADKTPLALQVVVSTGQQSVFLSGWQNPQSYMSPRVTGDWIVEGEGVTVAPPGSRSHVFVTSRTVTVKSRINSLTPPANFSRCENGFCSEYKFLGFTRNELFCGNCGEFYQRRLLATGSGTGGWMEGRNVPLFSGIDSNLRIDRDTFASYVYYKYDYKEWEEQSGKVLKLLTNHEAYQQLVLLYVERR